ncbi:hypothetical protein HOLleu_21666 [Holothuria leucospilota]|uniref:Ig-like domain-containing protein n=1 Tax=Holothuria leucospilota TaxID=206669 RepID=A0A9Q1H6Z3_HOLLE|nr:hypothetical protein HOLleu_21666 [Holothuria leucospilota]
MRINFSTLLPFLLFHVFKGSSAQTVHDVVTYTTKSREKLECSFSSSIKQWTDQRDDGKAINLFLYDVSKGLPQKQTNDSKYNNFNYSIEGTNGFNLVINNVDRGDGGRYLCNPIVTSDSVTFDVTVEVLPKSVSIHCTEINVCMPSAEKKADPKINCVCTATGLSSSVLEIEWEGVGIFTASPTSIMNSTSGSFIIRSNITLPPPNGTATVSCSLSGYRSEIPKRLRSYTYTFSPPVCNLVHYCPSDGTNASLICSCSKGSPKVNAYTFYDSQKSPIGTQRSNSKSVQVETNKVEMFYCSGCNGVLHNRIEGHEFNCKQGQGSAWWIFIVILPVVVVAAIICFVVKKHLCSKGKGVGSKRKQDGKSGIKPDISTSGDPATKDKDKGIKPDVSTSGDPATKDKDKEEEKKPLLNDQAPKNDKDDKGKKEPDNDVPQRDTPKKKGAKKDPSKNLEPKAEAPKAEAPKTEVSKKEGEDRGKKEPDNDVPQRDTPKKKGAKKDPSKNLEPKAEAPKAEAPKTEVSKKEGEDRLEAGGSEVDPEGYRTNKQSNRNNPKRGAENEVKSSQKNGSNEQAAPSSTERSQGDGQDNDAQGIEEATNRNDDGSKSNSKEQAYPQHSSSLYHSALAGIN